MTFTPILLLVAQVPPRISPQMTAQASLDAQMEGGNSSFADFAQFPESVIEVNHFINKLFPSKTTTNRFIYLSRRLKIINHIQLNPTIIQQQFNDHPFPHFNHQIDRVHLKYIENQHRVNQPHHPIHRCQINQAIEFQIQPQPKCFAQVYIKMKIKI